MYSHIKSLKRLGVGASDVPSGSSMTTAAGGGGGGGVGGGGGGAGGGGGGAGGGFPATRTRPPPLSGSSAGSRNATAVTSVVTVGRGRVAGFGPSAAAARPSIQHAHADAFQRQRGVVNGLGGARDVNRGARGLPPVLPPRGGPARIATFDTLATVGEEGAARAAGRARRDAAAASKGRFPQLEGTGVHAVPPKELR